MVVLSSLVLRLEDTQPGEARVYHHFFFFTIIFWFFEGADGA